MSDAPKQKSSIPAVIAAVLLVAPVIAWKMSRGGGRLAAEMEAHPTTWPLRILLFCVVVIPSVGLMGWLRGREKATDPLGVRLLNLTGIVLIGALMVAALVFLDRSVS